MQHTASHTLYSIHTHNTLDRIKYYKYHHIKSLLLNTAQEVNPFNRFSVAMVMSWRLTRQDASEKAFPWWPEETCTNVSMHLLGVYETMCLELSLRSLSFPPIEEGKDWHDSLLWCTRPHKPNVGIVLPCCLWPSLSCTVLWPCTATWRHESASCSFNIGLDESQEPVPSPFFPPMNVPTLCLPPTLSQHWWNFASSSLALFLTLPFFIFSPLICHACYCNLCSLPSCTLRLSFSSFYYFSLFWSLKSSLTLSFLMKSTL